MCNNGVRHPLQLVLRFAFISAGDIVLVDRVVDEIGV